jgi:hypothetical protein
MNTNRRLPLYATYAVVMLFVCACATQKDPAQGALDAATSAVNNALTPDADKYAPKEVTALQARLADLKAKFDTKNYAGVILGRPDVVAAAAELTQTVATSKDAESKRLTAQWSDISTSLPKSFDTVQTRIDELGKSKRKPKNVDVQTARSDLEDAESKWNEAKVDYQNGKVTDALAASQAVKSQVNAAAAAINLQLQLPSSAG